MASRKRRSKDEVELAQDQLFASYARRIDALYRSLDNSQRATFFKEIDTFTRGLETSVKGSSAFDKETARRIREENGFTQEDLVEELGFRRAAYVVVSRLENGKIPKKRKSGSISDRYVNWLKKQGYDPGL